MFKHIKRDLPASIVVFLVALPLCLGIALASGAPPLSGIIAGIVGGLVVGMLSGSPLGVSGPAAGLTVIVLGGIESLPSFELFLSAVVLAGLVQVALGLLRAGVIGLYFPSSVIQGMLAAIGIIIFLKQIPHAIGYDADPEGELEFIQEDGYNTFSELWHAGALFEPWAVLIAAVSLAVLLFWETPWMKRKAWSRLLPGSLIAVVLGAVLQSVAPSEYALSLDHLVSIPLTDDPVSLLSFPDFSGFLSREVWILAITLAVVASLETLLCVEATDKLDPHKRITPTNRELLAQGIGNAVSGLIGGLPVTQVIVRSSANIQSGGVTKLSAVLHGAFLLIAVLSIPTLLNLIPLASLAAILLVVGYKLARPANFIKIYGQGARQFVPFLVTVLAIVFTDLLVGIGIGLATAVVSILLDHYRRPFTDYRVDPATRTCVVTLPEDVTFLHKAGLREALASIPNGGNIRLDASKAVRVDPDVLEIISDFREHAATDGITVEYIEPATTAPEKPLPAFKKALLLAEEQAE